jgi:hypothetical protein
MRQPSIPDLAPTSIFQQPHMEHRKTVGLQETDRCPPPPTFTRSTDQPHFFDLEMRSEWEQRKLCARAENSGPSVQLYHDPAKVPSVETLF